ncbi:hypothetical protein [Streptomyces sp. ODS28]|uniref:hypothetical protein n=1 Tax=Streptomyces sp. ODS28 TaxID=3136688 RepID=UPI0031ED00A0
MSTRIRRFSPAVTLLTCAVVLLALLAAVLFFAGQSIALSRDVLHKETSGASGVTYESGGARRSSDLYLMRISELTGTRYELRLGPGAEDYYYPVELHFGSAEPHIRDVRWQPDGVTVAFTSGESVRVPAENFRSMR